MSRICLIVASCFCLLSLLAYGCGIKTEPASVNETSSSVSVEPDSLSFIAENDFDNRFGDLQLGLLDLGNAYIWHANRAGHFIYYYDRISESSGVLCAKPECVHDDPSFSGENESCNGYAFIGVPTLSYYDGHIYWIASYKPSNEKACTALMRMNPDGTGKEFVKRIDLPDNYRIQFFCIHRGQVFIYCYEQLVSSGEPQLAVNILTSDIKGSFESIFRKEYGSCFPYVYLRFISSHMYFFCALAENSESGFEYEIHRYDLESGELEEMLSPIDFGNCIPTDFWVCDDETCYIATMASGEVPSCVYRVFNDEPKLCFENKSFDDDRLYSAAYLGDGAVYAVGVSSSADSESVIGLWVRDYNGNTLAKGDMPLSYRSDLPGDHYLLAIYNIGGDSDTVLCEIAEAWRNAEYPARHFLVRYRIIENHLEETLLISTKQA